MKSVVLKNNNGKNFYYLAHEIMKAKSFSISDFSDFEESKCRNGGSYLMGTNLIRKRGGNWSCRDFTSCELVDSSFDEEYYMTESQVFWYLVKLLGTGTWRKDGQDNLPVVEIANKRMFVAIYGKEV